MPIQQQLWSLECSVVETVVSLLRGVTEHCLAGIQSHCLDKVDDIQPVRKSSTNQCNSFFENRDLEWYSHSCKMSFFDKLILGVCLLHPVFLSDVTGVTTDYRADSALSFLRQKIWAVIYDPPGIISTNITKTERWPFSDSEESLRSKCAFSVDIKTFTFTAASVDWQLHNGAEHNFAQQEIIIEDKVTSVDIKQSPAGAECYVTSLARWRCSHSPDGAAVCVCCLLVAVLTCLLMTLTVKS